MYESLATTVSPTSPPLGILEGTLQSWPRCTEASHCFPLALLKGSFIYFYHDRTIAVEDVYYRRYTFNISRHPGHKEINIDSVKCNYLFGVVVNTGNTSASQEHNMANWFFHTDTGKPVFFAGRNISTWFSQVRLIWFKKILKRLLLLVWRDRWTKNKRTKISEWSQHQNQSVGNFLIGWGD